MIGLILTVLIMATSLMNLAVHAQDVSGEKLQELFATSTPEERADFLTTKMREFLNLREDQTEQVKDINLRYALENERVYRSSQSTLTKYLKIKDLGKQKDSDLEKVLDEEQFKKYLAKKKEIMDQIEKSKK